MKKVAVIVSRGSFNNFVQVATLIRALTAVPDRSVRVFFRDEALLKVTNSHINETNFSQAYQGLGEAVLARLQAADFHTLHTFLRDAKQHGDDVQFFACASSMFICGLHQQDLIPEIDAICEIKEFLETAVSDADAVLTF
ncbi:MAG: DsrE family protein [Acidobacteriota bacterium]|nr:DsrE/DsrF/DrsH-like family protein [Blastocatellia bacterium]MDW8239310.1 DsrE family protein [Acidobacteriota bacterium]